MIIIQKYNSIMAKSEEHRNKWAIGLSTSLTILIFVSFAFYKGYLSFGINTSQSKTQVAAVVTASSAPSPFENTKETFRAAFSEIGKQYKQFTDSVSSVLVPFVTGIEVYERK
jgi:hypothetical protein